MKKNYIFKTVCLSMALTFLQHLLKAQDVTITGSQTITGNKNFSGTFYGFNGNNTPWYTEGLQTGWQITHSRLDVTDPSSPSIMVSLPTSNPSNPINFGVGGLIIGVAGVAGQWSESNANIGDAIIAGQGPSTAKLIFSGRAGIVFNDLPSYSGSSFATQSWVGSNGYTTATGTTAGYIPTFTSSTTMANSPIYTTGGQVGIGTTNTKGYMLAVNGSAVFTQVVVKTYANWPDYVFAPKYKLLSLDSLETYIKTKDHLPEVPSSQDVQKNGTDLASNQAILLKKVEELTLYIINQNKKLEVLEKNNNNQNKKIEELSEKVLTLQKKRT